MILIPIFQRRFSTLFVHLLFSAFMEIKALLNMLISVPCSRRNKYRILKTVALFCIGLE